MSPRHLRRSALLTRRFAVVAGIAVVLASALVADVKVSAPESRQPPATGVGAAASAISSAWYCPITRATKKEPTTGAIWITNPQSVIITALATIHPTDAPPVDVPLNLAPATRTLLRPSDHVDSSFAAVSVRVDGGGIAVDHAVRDATGEATASCSSTTSDRWHFVSGNTIAGSTLLLGLFNPYQDDSVFDVRVNTNEGEADPPDLRGVVVPARAMVVLNLSEQIRRRDWVVGEIEVRRGRLAVDQLQIGMIDNVRGLGLTPATPSVSTTWHLPGGILGDGLTDRLSIYNPSEAEAVVRVAPTTDAQAIEPFELHVPSHNRFVLDLHAEARMPKNVPYGLEITSTNGVAFVAGRSATSSPPSSTAGASIESATSTTSKRWLLAAGAVVDPADEWVYVMNPAEEPADVVVTTVGDARHTPLPSFRVEPHHQVAIHLDQSASVDGSVMVESTADVVVGRRLTSVPGPSLSSSLGIPLR